jgi:hypothetical protein
MHYEPKGKRSGKNRKEVMKLEEATAQSLIK